MLVAIFIATIFSPLAALMLLVAHYPGKGRPLPFATLFGLAISGIAFGLYNTSIYSDLTRFMEQAMWTQGLSYQESLNLFSQTHISESPIAVMWFWLVGKTGNAQWYPASIAFVEYAAIGYMAFDYALSSGYTRRQVAFMIFFLIVSIPLFDSITSVRSTPSLAIGALAVYLECYKKKHRILAIFLYLLAPFIHSVGLLVFLVRVLCEIAKRNLYLALLLAAALLPCAYYLSPLADAILSPFGFKVAGKLQSYISGGDTEYSLHVAQSRFIQVRKWVTVFLVLSLVVADLKQHGYLSAHTRRRLKVEELALLHIGCIFSMVLLAFAIMVSVPSYSRLGYVAVPLTGLPVATALVGDWKTKRLSYGNGIRLWHFASVVFLGMYFGLTCVNLSWRVDVLGLCVHILLGFSGAMVI